MNRKKKKSFKEFLVHEIDRKQTKQNILPNLCIGIVDIKDFFLEILFCFFVFFFIAGAQSAHCVVPSMDVHCRYYLP